MTADEDELATEALAGETAPPFQPGEMLAGRYRVEALLGSGGMGRVYLVTDTLLDRVVALKMLRVEHAAAVERFRREVRLASRVTHPNVIRLFDLGASGSLLFVTMEHVPGVSLRNRIARGPLTVAEAAEIARQVAMGLGAAHACGIVHRDLKPENVLLDTDGRVVVADFGVAREDAGNDPSSAIVGTSAYMSPEQANGEAATPGADLYALGLVLYEMLAGEVPLVGKGPVGTALRRLRETVPRLRDARPDAPTGLDTLVTSLLAVDPAARPRSAAEVAESLADWAVPLPSGLVSTSPRPRTGTVGRPPVALRRAVLPLAIVAMLAAGVFTLRARSGVAADPAAVTIFTVDASADADLPPELAFLRDVVDEAAYRALVAQVPGRVARGRVAGAVPVHARLLAHDGAFVATVRAASVEATGESRSAIGALDEAARRLVGRTLPDGPAPLPADRARRAAWGAPDEAAVLAFRRAEAACARVRGGEAVSILLPLERPGFARPLVAHIFMLDELEEEPLALLRRARELAPAAPPGERALLEAAIAVAATDVRGAQVLGPPAPEDPWDGVVRAWSLALAGRTDEAFATADRLARDPERGGIGLYLANRLAHYYDRGRRVRTAEALADALPEEPGRWIDVAEVRAWEDDLAGAQAAVDRARTLGAGADAVADVEAQLAVARVDADAAVRSGRQLLSSPSANRRLGGQLTLYAAEVLQGSFELAAERAPVLIEALRAAGRIRATEVAQTLTQDAFARGDRSLARRFAEVALEMSSGLDHDWVAGARLRLAALDHLDGRLDAAAYAARLREVMAEMRRHGIGGSEEDWLAAPRLMVTMQHGDCGQLTAGVRRLLEESEPLAVAAVAACEIDADRPDAALTRLEPMFRRTSRRMLPTLVVRRGLLLGRALHAMGRHAEARPHLERTVQLWGQIADNREVALARRLLADAPAGARHTLPAR